MYTHSIYSRIDGVLVPTGHSVELAHNYPVESLIRSCDDLAKAAIKANPTYKNEAFFAYKVDSEIAYFISGIFFLWPNHLEREDYGKSSGEGQRFRRREHSAGSRARSNEPTHT